ncbi:MAG: hypothetical protein AAGJ81_10405 [Verrucomicrobiota bacterium]
MPHLLEGVAGVRTVQDLLGRKSAETPRVYLHVMQKPGRESGIRWTVCRRQRVVGLLSEPGTVLLFLFITTACGRFGDSVTPLCAAAADRINRAASIKEEVILSTKMPVDKDTR